MSQSRSRLMLLLVAAFLLSGQASARSFVVSGNLIFIDGVSKQLSAEGDPPDNPVLIAPLRLGDGRMVHVIVRRTTDDRIVGEAHTDSRGVFNVIAEADPGDPLRVQFEGFNYASRVYANMDCGNDHLLGSGDPFTAPAGGDVNIGVQFFSLTYRDVVSGRCGGFGEGDYTATVTFSAALNINNNLLHVRQYADANRDPAEGDSIPRVDVEYCNDRWNSYDGDIVVTCYHSPKLDANFKRVDWGYMDATSPHEFGHHLQINIGARNGWVLDPKHSFCTQYTGRDNDRADFAFQEGWPDYFAAWLVTNNPEMVFPPNVWNYEAPCVSTAASVPPLERGSAGSGVKFPAPAVFARWNHVEGLVAGFLFDLADGRGAGEDAWDLVDGPGINGDRRIFNIFDRELDRDGLGLFSNSPSLNDLYTAWVDRYGDDLGDGWPALDLLLNGVGITPRTNHVNEQLFPPTGIVGAIPNAGSTGLPLTVSYAPLTNELTLQNRLSFARGDAVATGTGIKTFVSNIGPGNAPWNAAHAKQAHGEGAASAIYDIGLIAYSTIASVGGIEPTGWLGADLGSFLPGLLLPKRMTGFVLNEIDAVTPSMPRGTFIATVPVEFDITTESGASILQTREIVYELVILDTASDDSDRDGVDNQTERRIPCLDPLNPDTDGDGISDGDERNIYRTNACNFDSDGDGQSDGAEIRLGCSNPRDDASRCCRSGSGCRWATAGSIRLNSPSVQIRVTMILTMTT